MRGSLASSSFILCSDWLIHTRAGRGSLLRASWEFACHPLSEHGGGNLAVPIVAHGVQDSIDLISIFCGKYPGM